MNHNLLLNLGKLENYLTVIERWKYARFSRRSAEKTPRQCAITAKHWETTETRQRDDRNALWISAKSECHTRKICKGERKTGNAI